MNNKKGSLTGFTSQRSGLIIWGVIGLVLMSNLGAIIDSFLHPEIEYFDSEHMIVGGVTALVFGIMFLMILSYLDRFERTVCNISQSEKALRESEEKLKTMIETSPDGIATSTLDGKIQFATKKLVSMMGYSSTDELIGRDVMEFIHSSDQEKMGYLINELLNGHLTGPAECLLVKKDGSLFYAEANANILCDAAKNPIGILYLERNITERKKVEDKLRESEERYRFLTNNIPDIIYSLDGEGNIVTINSPAFEHYGYTEQDSKGKPFLNFIHPEDRETVIGSFLKALEERRRFTQGLQFRIMAGNGVSYWFELNSQARFDSQGQYMGEEGVLRDITERKKAEESLRESESRLYLATRAGNIGIWDWNIVKNELIWDDSMYSLYGIHKDDFGGAYEAWTRTLHPDDRQYIDETIQAVLRGEQEYAPEFRIVRADGAIRIFKAAAQTMRDQNGKALRMIGINYDITERKQAEEEIRKLNATLEQRVEERTLELRDAQEQLVRHEKLSVLGQMASSVGHELRNPLAVMASALYYLKLVQPNADQKIKQYLDMLGQEVRTSEKIISDLLDFARIKSVDREAVSVSDLVRLTLERFPVPESVQSILDIPADLPQVYVDPRQMTQVLGNLVVNACQAMVPGRSGGKLSIIGNIQNDMIHIVVKDNGSGISPENMKKIFDPLFTTKVKGIGLGLAVSQKLVDANGGSIQVESEAGAGSAFTVSLPIYQPG